MLKKATWSSLGRPRSLVSEPFATLARQYAGQINYLQYPSSGGQHTRVLRRNSSTNHNGPVQETNAENPGTVSESTSDAQSSSAVGEEDSGKQSFTLTPRFQWRWRWTFPRMDGTVGKRTKRKAPISNDMRPTNPDGIAHFVPTRSDEQQQDLDSVINSLGTLAEELRVPQSPLEKKMENKEWRPKRQPTKQERTKLAYNPWAMMLAGSIRQDSASKIRFPKPLLLELGEVSNPAQDSAYLMPDDLANLEAFDKRLEKGLRRLAMINLHRKIGGSTVNLLPYKNLVEDLTNQIVHWDRKEQRGRSKHGVVAKRLLPPRWFERTQKITAYQEASKEYWALKESQGELDDRFFKRPEKPFDVSTLQWQPNIGERIQSIMRQRLLMSIDHLGRKTDEPKNKPRMQFMCFDWPESLYLDVVSESTKISTSSLVADDQFDPASTRYSLAAQHYRPEDRDHHGGIDNKQIWTPNPSTYHFSDPSIWLPGSYFLHVGPAETTLSALPYLREHASPSPSSNNKEEIATPPPPQSGISKYIPPMLTVNDGYRLPVFNIHALLGPKFEHPLRQVLARHDMLLSKTRHYDADNAADPDANYLILIRGTAPGSHYIAQELWQLWRYVGGTDLFQSHSNGNGDGDGGSSGSVTKTKTLPPHEAQIRRFSMSKKAWDHFYTYLPGIERRPVNADA